MTGLGFDRPEWLWAFALAVPIVVLAFWSRRRLASGRRFTALGVRLLLLASIVLALAGPSWSSAVDALGVVFVVDRSASVGNAGAETARRFIEEAVAHQGPDDRVGVVVFGAESLVEAEPTEALQFHGVEARPSPHQSDIAAGLRLASALLPADRTRRLVLLSDGEQTRGDAAAQALLLADDDLTLSVVPLADADGPDVLVEELYAPAKVEEGAPFDVKVALSSGSATSGTLRLYRNTTYLGELAVDLDAGRTKVLSFRQQAVAPGLHRFRTTFTPDDPASDSRSQNNEGVTTVQVTGRARILVAENRPADAAPLVGALEGAGFDVTLVDPSGLPPGLEQLRAYDALFLSDVPAFALSTRQQRAIQSFVRDLGRGLVMIGGENSFGVGGYYDSPVEAALPVGMDIEDKTRFPKLGMVHAIDKSCSMGGGAGSKLALAKEAALQTVDLLSENDLLGVIGFDGAASFIVPLEPLLDKPAVMDDIASVRPGGSTDIYPALERSITALRSSDAALKHIILLSDGMTSAGAFEALIREAHDQDLITLTTIGTGSDSDRRTMEEFARWGGGNYYLVTDPAAIPAIFTRETLLATREFLKEEDVRPERAGPSELTAGVDPARLPPLHGYVVTTPKARATVPLVVPADEHTDPLLAHWRYGLGRAVAWTSDAKGRWASGWVNQPAYTRLWAQIARFAVARGGDGAVQVETALVDGRLEITVDAFEPDGGFRNFLEGKGRVVAPDLTVREVELLQVAPGRYRASVPVDQDGSWLVGVSMSADGQIVGQAVEEAVQPYSPEYRRRGAGDGLMEELARVGRGDVLADPASVFTRPTVSRQIPRPLWPWAMAAAVLLLVLDVAIRRLAFPTGPTASLTVPARPPTRPVSAEAPAVLSSDTSEDPDDEDPPDGPPPPDVAPGSYAGRLLAAKKRRNR
jgi:uncharacterized membrane protein